MKLKVVDILKSFSKDDLKNFGDYLSSPVFNKRKVITELFKAYKNFYPGFSDKNFSKEKIFRKLFSEKKYNDEIFRNLNSILLKHAEDFLAYINFSKDPFTVKKHLLSEINHRGLFSIFEKNFAEVTEILTAHKWRDVDYFYKEFEIYLQKDNFNTFKYNFSPEDILKSKNSLLIFFLIQFMEIQNYVLYQCRVAGLEWKLYVEDGMVDEILKKLPREISQLPQIQIDYNALKLEYTSDEKYYNKLKLLLKDYGHLIDKGKHYNKYIDLIDYIKRTGSTGDMKTLSEIFELRKEIIEKDLFMENTITNMFFLNVVKSGTRLKQFDWIQNFITRYEAFLIPRYRDITRFLSLAIFHFEKKEYDKSLSAAALVKYESNFYNLEVKNLTSRIYFEMNEYESLITVLNSYSMYLSKNRTLDSNTRMSHSLFVGCLKKLQKIKEQKKFYRLDELSNQIAKKEFINKYWIEEKIFEMM